jgi:hypothetical protein
MKGNRALWEGIAICLRLLADLLVVQARELGGQEKGDKKRR